jgi:hypothetical protein
MHIGGDFTVSLARLDETPIANESAPGWALALRPGQIVTLPLRATV